MTIVIPMAGASSRFFNAGYEVPKYMLQFPDGETMFEKSVSSFKSYFNIAEFNFVVNSSVSGPGIEMIIPNYCKKIGIKYYRIYDVKRLTRGQAETVFECLQAFGKEFSKESLFIFNIDTILHFFELPSDNMCAGFHAFYDIDADEHKWSFADADETTLVIKKTAEKQKVGPWCSTGLYYFHSCEFFASLYLDAQADNNYNYYIAPLYNLINHEYYNDELPKILICRKQDVTFVGVPEEYEAYRKTFEK